MPRHTFAREVTSLRWADHLDDHRERVKWARLLAEIQAAATARLHENGAAVSQGAKQEAPDPARSKASTAPHQMLADGRAASAQYTTRR